MARSKRNRTQSSRRNRDARDPKTTQWTPSAIPAPEFVQSAGEFRQMLAHLSGQPWIALDTESDSLYRYTPRVCLIQISAPGPAGTRTSPGNPIPVVDYLIDCLHLPDLSELGAVLASEKTEVILHAAENDILCLQRDFDFRICRLFDTQLAARIMGRKGIGLAAILQEEFGVVTNKRMQRTNWGQRPLTPQQMTYAQIDTHYLPALRNRQYQRLQNAGRWEEAQAAFRILESVEYTPPDPRQFWQMKQLRSVPAKDLGVVQAVWAWREQVAARLDRPPFKILGENVIIELAEKRPATRRELANISGLSQQQIGRYGQELLAAVQKGASQPIPERPQTPPRPEQTLVARERTLYETLRRWRSHTAKERKVDPDIVFSNDTLLQIIATRPESVSSLSEIPSVGQWKAETYGPAVLALIADGGGS